MVHPLKSRAQGSAGPRPVDKAWIVRPPPVRSVDDHIEKQIQYVLHANERVILVLPVLADAVSDSLTVGSITLRNRGDFCSV